MLFSRLNILNKVFIMHSKFYLPIYVILCYDYYYVPLETKSKNVMNLNQMCLI